jgi:hypothetical protein
MNRHTQSDSIQTKATQHALAHLCHEASSHGCSQTALILNALYKLELQHDSAHSTRSILDLTAILGLSVNCNILREAVVDPMASLSVPATHTFIHTDHLRLIEIVCSMLVKIFNNIINKLPPKYF